MSLEVIQAVMSHRDGLMAAVEPTIGPVLRAQVGKMGDASLFHLATALVAISTPGVEGDLVLRVPRKLTDRVEVFWRSAPD